MTDRSKSPATGGFTIFHNPACGTSRNVLQAIREAGYQPAVVEYLKVGWRRDQLTELLAKMEMTARELLRTRGAPPAALELLGDAPSDDQIIDAMVAYPILVERPIVVAPKGVALCRPAERIFALF